MIRIQRYLALIAALLCSSAFADERMLVKEVTVRAPLAAVWNAWTTEDGLEFVSGRLPHLARQTPDLGQGQIRVLQQERFELLPRQHDRGDVRDRGDGRRSWFTIERRLLAHERSGPTPSEHDGRSP